MEFSNPRDGAGDHDNSYFEVAPDDPTEGYAGGIAPSDDYPDDAEIDDSAFVEEGVESSTPPVPDAPVSAAPIVIIDMGKGYRLDPKDLGLGIPEDPPGGKEIYIIRPGGGYPDDATTGPTEPAQKMGSLGPGEISEASARSMGTSDEESRRVFERYIKDALEAAKAKAPESPEEQAAPSSPPFSLVTYAIKRLIDNSRRQVEEADRARAKDELEGFAAEQMAEVFGGLVGYERGGSDVEAFLDSLYPLDGRQPEVARSEQKAAGAVIAEAALSPEAGGRAYSDLLGETRENYRYDVATGRLYAVAVTTVVAWMTEIAEMNHAVTVREVRPDGMGRTAYYEIGRDGVARRTDLHEPTEAEREAMEASLQEASLHKPFDEMTEEEKVAQLRSHIEILSNLIGNADLEETFGLRRQPVGLAEARRLAALILRRPEET
ncbi:MAG TPA: hypothetical protein VFM05_15415 [Candidatus Saccharimonadales bacterium]|nr:hypothetical protein [Candidatus Saccharimonadales bacterium]